MDVAKLLKAFLDLGVETVVSCPGGRNAALLNAFIDSGQFKIESLYDERSAGFYALGKSIQQKKPVVVLTTSGSAVAELYPSLLESKYQEAAQLIAVTADRPLAFSKTGAPQTIVQSGIFETNGIKTINLRSENTNDLNFFENCDYPLHINLEMDDPNPIQKTQSKFNLECLVIISSLKEEERLEVLEEFKNYSGQLVLESLSNLSKDDFPKAQVIQAPDVFLNKVSIHSFKSIYRIGGVPLLKSWREADLHQAVFYWNRYHFPGTLNAQGKGLLQIQRETAHVKNDQGFKMCLEAYQKHILNLMGVHSLSETSRIKELSLRIPKNSKVFIGNSMPIRNWEFVDFHGFQNFGQRGVNGIDGSVALALGAVDKTVENWLILGDLTTLYNINDFQVLQNLSDAKIRIVVVNNKGGRIFEKIFSKNQNYFINEHSLSFKKIASLWGIKFIHLDKNTKYSCALSGALPDQCLIELEIDSLESLNFWRELEAIKF